jgi:hypothetical protein
MTYKTILLKLFYSHIWGYTFGMILFWLFMKDRGEVFGYNLIGGIFIFFLSFIASSIVFIVIKSKYFLVQIIVLGIVFSLSLGYMAEEDPIIVFRDGISNIWHFYVGLLGTYALINLVKFEDN